MWATEEFSTVQLGDKWLNSRLVKLAEQLPAKSMASVSAAGATWATWRWPTACSTTGFPPVWLARNCGSKRLAVSHDAKETTEVTGRMASEVGAPAGDRTGMPLH
jgi:hypothetical protein